MINNSVQFAFSKNQNFAHNVKRLETEPGQVFHALNFPLTVHRESARLAYKNSQKFEVAHENSRANSRILHFLSEKNLDLDFQIPIGAASNFMARLVRRAPPTC